MNFINRRFVDTVGFLIQKLIPAYCISGSSPPPKPWERSGSSSGPAPFKPPSAGTTSDIVEASGTARPGEIVTPDANTTAANRNAIGRSLPSRPWEQQQTYGNNSSYMGILI